MSKKNDCLFCQALGFQKVLQWYVVNSAHISFLKYLINLCNKFLFENKSGYQLFFIEKENIINLYKSDIFQEVA